MDIKQQYLPVPSKRRSGIPIEKITYIVAHDTGGIDGTAQHFVNSYLNSANDIEASAHVFVDHKEQIWCIPETEKSWSVRYSAGIPPNIHGNFANDHAIAVELCYFTSPYLTGLAYNNYCELIADLCRKYSLDPLTSVVAHSKLDPTRRTDPQNAFAIINKSWEQFLVDVSNIIKKHMPDVTPETPQVLKIKSITVTHDVLVNGEVVGTDLAPTVTITPELLEALKLPNSGLIEEGYTNVTLE